MAPGYDVELINEEDNEDDFFCLICHNLVKEASACCQVHVFCNECLTEHIEKSCSDPLVCPGGCGVEIDVTKISANKYVDRLIQKLECKCKNCDWEGALMAYIKENHEESCLAKTLLCRYQNVGCTFEGTKESMEYHEQSSVNSHLSLTNKFISKENHFMKQEIKSLKSEKEQNFSEIEGSKAIQNGLIEKYDDMKENITELKESLFEENKKISDENEKLISLTNELTLKLSTLEEKIKEKENQRFYFIKYLPDECADNKDGDIIDKEYLQRFIGSKVLCESPFKDYIQIPPNFNIHQPENNMIIMKDILFSSEINHAFYKGDFSASVAGLTKQCGDFFKYEKELTALMKIPTAVLVTSSNDHLTEYIFIDLCYTTDLKADEDGNGNSFFKRIFNGIYLVATKKLCKSWLYYNEHVELLNDGKKSEKVLINLNKMCRENGQNKRYCVIVVQRQDDD